MASTNRWPTNRALPDHLLNLARHPEHQVRPRRPGTLAFGKDRAVLLSLPLVADG